MSLPFLGHGVGLRVPHYARALTQGLDVEWVEAISENFFGGGGRPWAVLERLRSDMPVAFHGVSMGVGSQPAPARSSVGPQPSDGTAQQPLLRYLSRLRALASAFQPAWVSDHLSWTHFDGTYSHDLLPLPYTEEALELVVANVQFVQDYLGRPLLLENVSSYVSFSSSQLSEWDFLSELSRRSGCYLLLDLNNIVVSAANHGFSPHDYLRGVRASHVAQLHLANHSLRGSYRFDDHRGPVCEEAWQLYRDALELLGPVSSLVEWDEDVPPWEVLREEQRKAARLADEVLGGRDASVTPRCLEEGGVRLRLPTRNKALAGESGQHSGSSHAEVCLADAQALMLAAITAPLGVADFLESADERVRARFEHVFVQSSELSRVERVDIYANSYFYRLLDVLSDLFPRARYACGAAAFHNLVTDYLLAHPSRDADLRNLGSCLPRFLEEHALLIKYPGLRDLVSLEQALNHALDSPGGLPLAAQDLQAIPPESWSQLRFELTPPTRLFQAGWDVCAFDRAFRGERLEQCQELLITPRAGWVLVGRRGFQPYFRPVDGLESLALSRCAEGLSFGALCQQSVEWLGGGSPEPLVDLLRQWLESGLLQWRALPT